MHLFVCLLALWNIWNLAQTTSESMAQAWRRQDAPPRVSCAAGGQG